MLTETQCQLIEQELTESVGFMDTLKQARAKAAEVMPEALERLRPE